MLGKPTSYEHSTHDKVDVIGVQVSALRFAEIQDLIDQAIDQKSEPLVIFYANAHTINLAWSDIKFRTVLNQADIVYCDGFGVKLLARLLGHQIPERFTAPDWLQWIGPHWAAQGYRVFWLGAARGVAEYAARQFEQSFPHTLIAGTHHGYFRKDDFGSAPVIEEINSSRADILLLGFGTPAQETWALHYHRKLNVKVIIVIGGAIDYMAGKVKHGPAMLTDHGFEWLTRLIREPRRLAIRYLIGLPQLGLRFLLYLFRRTHPR